MTRLRKMSRRNFMASLAATAAASQLPALPQFSSAPYTATGTITNLVPGADVWMIDKVNKRILYRGAPDGVYTIKEMYSCIQDQMDEVDNLDSADVMFGITPTMFELADDWRLDDSCPAHLNHGSITQGDQVWSSIVELEQGCAPRPLPLAPHNTQPDDSQSAPGWNQLRYPGVMYVPVNS